MSARTMKAQSRSPELGYLLCIAVTSAQQRRRVFRPRTGTSRYGISRLVEMKARIVTLCLSEPSLGERGPGGTTITVKTVIIVTLALHVLPSVFWAGSTFVLAHPFAVNVERLAYPQSGAAILSIIAGAILWKLLGHSGQGAAELTLAVGAATAVIAAVLQLATLPAVRRLKDKSAAVQATSRKRGRLTQRVGASLLSITVICMVIWRFV